MQRISIVVDTAEMDALRKLFDLVPESDEAADLKLKAVPLFSNLQATYEEALENAKSSKPTQRRTNKSEVDKLKTLVDKQRWQISGLMVQAMLSKQMTFLAGQNNTAVAASLIGDPEPILLRCINHGDLEVKPLNIIAIKAKGKTKVLYLRKAITPKRSSTKYLTFEVRSGFDELIKKIQPQVPSFLRVHDSFVINVRAFRLLRSGVFKLNHDRGSFEDPTYNAIRRIETDFKFNEDVFQKVVKDVEANDEYIAKFQPTKAAMTKINGYMEYFADKYGNKA